MTLAAGMMAIEMNLHGDTIAWLIDSYERWPPGTAASPEVFGQAIIEQTLASFLLSVRLAIPVASVGVVGTVLLGVCGRVIPRLGLQNVGFAISLLGGLWALAEAGPSMVTITVNTLSEVVHG
jgi:flagellar biosynthesis protein FliR